MKAINKQIKSIAIIFAVLVIFQSCKTTYHDSFESVLFKASKKHTRVKIETKDGQTLKYSKVICSGDSCFQVKRIHGNKIITPINWDNIKSVKTKDKVFLDVLKFTGEVILGVLVVTFVVWGYFSLQAIGDEP
jgi:hypothetical protein